MPYVKSMDRDQLMMTTLDMLVDQDSIVRVMDAFVESLDLQKLGFLFAEPGVTGRPAYNPSALLKLYIYGYKNSVRSSRKLQHECHVNLEVRWLTGGLEPDFRTISDFRKNNADALVRVFNEFNKIFHSYLLNGFVSIDGSKFLANNSKDNNFTLNKLDDRITWLETDMVKCLENGIIPHVIPDDGKDTYELTMDYQENETDPSSSNINDINTCLHAGVLPEAYREVIDSISISEKKVFEEPDLSNLKSPFQSEEEMLAKAKDGYFVRDPERNLSGWESTAAESGYTSGIYPLY